MAGSFGEEFVFPELGGAEAAEAMHPEVTGTPIKVSHVFGTCSFRTTDARDQQSFSPCLNLAFRCLTLYESLRKRTAPKRGRSGRRGGHPSLRA